MRGQSAHLTLFVTYRTYFRPLAVFLLIKCLGNTAQPSKPANTSPNKPQAANHHHNKSSFILICLFSHFGSISVEMMDKITNLDLMDVFPSRTPFTASIAMTAKPVTFRQILSCQTGQNTFLLMMMMMMILTLQTLKHEAKSCS